MISTAGYVPVLTFVICCCCCCCCSCCCCCCCCSLSCSWRYNNVRSPASSKHLTLCSSHSACLYLEDDEGRTFSKHMPVSQQDANNHIKQWHEIRIISVWWEDSNNPTLNHLILYIELNIWWHLHKTAIRFTTDTSALAVEQPEAKPVCSHFWMVHGSCLVWILAWTLSWGSFWFSSVHPSNFWDGTLKYCFLPHTLLLPSIFLPIQYYHPSIQHYSLVYRQHH